MFLDDTWIEDHQRLTRLWHKADIFPEPVLRPEMPWEGTNVTMYGTVFRMGEAWRMYYSTYKPREEPLMCVAESADGLHWSRLTVGEIEYQGSKENNIVMRPANCPSVYYEPEDIAAPFKMIRVAKGGIYGATSKDGLRWATIPEPLVAPTGTSST